jgi:hypothetical protein
MIALEWSVTVVSLNPELFYSDAVVLNDLEIAHERYKQGERDSIVDTLMICAKYQAVIPDWLANELIEIEFKIRSGEVKDFNEFFGFNHVNAHTLKNEHLINKHEKEVYGALLKARLDGEGFGQILFEKINDETGVPLKKIREIYGRNKASLIELPKGNPENINHGFIHTNIPLNDGRRYGRGVLKDKD